MITLENVCVEKDSTPILSDISLSFGEGGITALIGPNGAGKSTLLHSMSGLLTPNKGTVKIDGHDLATLRAPDRAQLISLLAQDERVTARLTIEDLVSFGRWPHHHGRPTARDKDVVAEALETFDLTDLKTRLIASLSGGQRQRAFIAMAWAQETPWLLLDEPLSALDPRHTRDIMDRLHTLSRPGPNQRSVIIVLHDLGVAARYADRIIALKDGKLVTTGPKWLSMTGRMLSDLFGTGLSVAEVDGKKTVVPA